MVGGCGPGDVIVGHVDGRDKIKEKVGPEKRIKGGQRHGESPKHGSRPIGRYVRRGSLLPVRRDRGGHPDLRQLGLAGPSRHVSSWFERLRVAWAS